VVTQEIKSLHNILSADTHDGEKVLAGDLR